ncbi:MAG TPA: family 1 glycosylhydrolase [Lacisediminihabitans sp.]|uniref:family 1 glycosylhydrolase n=1 Tax=Lacisediminihabitans sp. TaxID=2787631 RepID=UPI002EDAA830
MNSDFLKGSFTWIAGIEDTCVYPPSGFGMQSLDEYDLTEHTLHWRDDLTLARDLGATAVRYGVNWPLVHTGRDSFDWSFLDERLRFAHEELGLTVIADLVHYGTPTWLEGSFADPGYPEAIEAFAGEFAARYRGIVDHLTPLNEPLTTASFCGLRGVWPPALTGWAGWTTVVMGMVHGMRRTISAVRAANPDAVIVHVEASSLYRASETELELRAALLHSLGMLPTDLLLGRVTRDHDMHGWLVEHGADPDALASFTEDVPVVDLMGVNYYPDLSPRTLMRIDGEVAQIATNRWQEGLTTSLTHFAERYGIPVLITETSIEGDDDVRAEWLDDSARAVSELREEGLDIRGYTWWPLLDFVDWSYASGGRNVEEFLLVATLADGADVPSAQTAISADPLLGKTAFLRRMGLIRLEESADGSLERIPTIAATHFRELSRGPAAVVGDADA